MKHAVFLLSATLLAGCAAIDRVAGEPFEASHQLPDTPDTWLIAGVSGEAPSGDWLAQFNDEVMVTLVNEALVANPTLRSRMASMDAAAAQARSVYGRTLPSLNTSASAGGTSNGIVVGNNVTRTTNSIFGLGL